MAEAVSPIFLERYELKYKIPLSMVKPICDFIAPYCEMDHYSEIAPDGFYKISSLYLDTPTLFFLRMKDAQLPHRFSMRVRSYGDDPKPPFFFETKYKAREFVKKRRGKVYLENWPDLFTDAELIKKVEGESKKNVEHFLNLSHTYNSSPVILTQYRRLAWLSTIDDYARVTFDRDLRYQMTTDFSCVPDERLLSHYDHPDSFLDPGTNVVLELKCERKIPQWIVDLVRHFELTRGSFSKYHNSMETQYLSQYGDEAFTMYPAESFAPLSF